MERIDPDLHADERTTLVAFLDYHRATFLGKIDGLTHEQMNVALAPSDLTLASLTKHLALVEDSWFQERFVGVEVEPWASAPFDDDRDWEMHSAKNANRSTGSSGNNAEAIRPDRGWSAPTCLRSGLVGDLARVFVVPETEEDGMTHQAFLGPFRECALSDQQRFAPRAFSNHLSGRRWYERTRGGVRFHPTEELVDHCLIQAASCCAGEPKLVSDVVAEGKRTE